MIAQNLHSLDLDELRQVAQSLVTAAAEREAIIQRKERELAFKQATIDKLTHEMAVLKRLKFAAKSEAFNAEQKSLIEEALDADLAALAREIETRSPAKNTDDKGQAKRAALPPELPRTEHLHEPESTTCRCGCQLKRIGEDVAEKLDYLPGVFSVERHIRGKWVCAQCETLVQAPVAPHIIDKGIPTTGLLAQVLVAKYQDHLPLYRQEHIFGRAGLAIPRSTLASWVGQCGVQLQPLVDALKQVMLKSPVLHADETPVAMLKPGNKRTHKAYIWTYCTTGYDAIKAVVFDFAEGRGGQYVRDFLALDDSGPAGWRGKLICDDFSGYKACFELGVTEVGCLAHARRKFHDRRDELAALGQTKRARAVRLSEGRADQAADAACRADRRVTAASMASRRHVVVRASAWPRAPMFCLHYDDLQRTAWSTEDGRPKHLDRIVQPLGTSVA